MGTYVKEYYPLLTNGTPLLSVLISQSFCESVYFEIHCENDKYYLYWNFEIPPQKLLPLIQKYLVLQGMKGVTMKEFETLAQEKRWIDYIQPHNRANRCMLNEDDELFFSNFIKQGLPELSKKPRWGLDGHSYEINIYTSSPRHYHCWCVVPRQWEIINEIVARLSKYVALEEKYFIHGVY